MKWLGSFSRISSLANAAKRLAAAVLLIAGAVAGGAEIERYDLDSISLQPAYVSPSLLRQSSSLRSVAVSPPNRHDSTPDNPIVIAVGDAGAIVRSDDGGQTWRSAESCRLDVPVTTTQFGRTPRHSQNSFPIPMCDFTDVLWASPLDVIVVGGGYEPITGISRGVCLLSRDGGLTWYLSDATELPRLQKIRMGGPASADSPRIGVARELAPGVLEALGDPSEASGVDHFYSYDGAQTWAEDLRTRDTSEDRDQAQADTIASHPRPTIRTSSGPVAVNGLATATDGGQFAVSSHGQIWRRDTPASRWQAVRGQGRRTAVLFVAATPATVPWSLAGRESLHENRRTAILLDGMANSNENRCRAAATMLGISDVNTVTEDAQRRDWLTEHQPAVVVLDESLSPATQRAWVALIDHIRTRPFLHPATSDSHSSSTVASDWTGPQRIILTRGASGKSHSGADRSNQDWYQHDHDVRWQRAWNHTSVLRGSALLSGPGVLANDMAIDALMLAAPQQTAQQAIEIATFEDISGSVRRDVALAGGAALNAGQNRSPSEVFTASNRRLQISTARMSQTRRLHDDLFHATRHSVADQSQLRDKIEQLLAVTAAEDRTRLLWEAMGLTMTSEHEFSSLPDVLLALLSDHGQPAAVQRWAALNEEAQASSVERRSITLLDQITAHRRTASNVLGNVASDVDRNSRGGEAPNAKTTAAVHGQTLSPFQVAPVSYQAELMQPEPTRNTAAQQTFPAFDPALGASTKTGPAIILVPERKSVQWQATRGWASMVAPMNSNTGSLGLKPHDKASDEPARINWDYHPVVMAARGIAPQNIAGGKAVNGPQSGEQAIRQVARYQPPTTSDRPLLDGRADDPCWHLADHWSGEGYQASCVADEDFLYLAVRCDHGNRLRLSLDCDGDYFTALRFEIDPDGSRRVCIDGAGTISPVWYAARTPEMDATHGSDKEHDVLAEIAIARASLPAPLCRIHVYPSRSGGSSPWQVMPNPSQWYPFQNK